jgi:oxalate decarboxylase/phosphoglucose isomerase-like protein (cupin superfamily)
MGIEIMKFTERNFINISHCKIMQLPKVHATSGNITSINNGLDVPFDVKRVFYIYDIPSGEDRGAHAHKECHQILVAISGAFEVEVFDGKKKGRFFLNQPNLGLHIPPGLWASEVNFSGGGICLVLTSHEYDPEDYIRNIRDFKTIKRK